MENWLSRDLEWPIFFSTSLIARSLTFLRLEVISCNTNSKKNNNYTTITSPLKILNKPFFPKTFHLPSINFKVLDCCFFREAYLKTNAMKPELQLQPYSYCPPSWVPKKIPVDFSLKTPRSRRVALLAPTRCWVPWGIKHQVKQLQVGWNKSNYPPEV